MATIGSLEVLSQGRATGSSGGKPKKRRAKKMHNRDDGAEHEHGDGGCEVGKDYGCLPSVPPMPKDEQVPIDQTPRQGGSYTGGGSTGPARRPRFKKMTPN
jgi:hypothetical protein